jgi:hypothetical protein
MATLAAQTETDLLVLIPNDTTLKWLTNQNDPSGASYVAAIVTKACTRAAEQLAGIVGTKTGDDGDAVDLCTRMALFKLRYSYRGLNPPEGAVTWADLLAEAQQMRDRDRQETTNGASWHAPDGADGDKRHPAAKRDRGYTKSTDYTG